jgi:hypothetical protein
MDPLFREEPKVIKIHFMVSGNLLIIGFSQRFWRIKRLSKIEFCFAFKIYHLFLKPFLFVFVLNNINFNEEHLIIIKKNIYEKE